MQVSKKIATAFKILTASIFLTEAQEPTNFKKVFQVNKSVAGTLRLSPINGDAASELTFCPNVQSNLGISRDSLDQRSCTFIYPVEEILQHFKVSGSNFPEGDFCWQWESLLFISEYEYGFGTEAGFDLAKAKLLSAKKFKKYCTEQRP